MKGATRTPHQSRNATGDLLVQLTVSDLRDLLVETVATALAEQSTAEPPTLLDLAGLARVLGVSTRTIYTLRQAGLPTLWVCESPRFELAPVIEWLRVNGQPPASSANVQRDGAAVLPLDSRGAAGLSAPRFQHEPETNNDSGQLRGGRRQR